MKENEADGGINEERQNWRVVTENLMRVAHDIRGVHGRVLTCAANWENSENLWPCSSRGLFPPKARLIDVFGLDCHPGPSCMSKGYAELAPPLALA